MADVFLSYSLRDNQVAARLVNELQLAGLSVAWDRDFLPGTSITESLQKGIAESKAFVLLVPEEVDSSEFLRRETDTAMVRSATGDLLVLPVLLPGRKPAGDVARFRYISVESERNLSSVAEVVSKAVHSAGMPRPTGERLRVFFLATLLRTDLARAPLAASLVLDEISQSVVSDIDDVGQQLTVLRDAVGWGRAHLGTHHPSVTLLMHRLVDALLRSGRYEESIELSRAALDTTTNPKDRLEASINLGNALLAVGRDSEAEHYYHEALAVAQTLSSDSASGIAWVALGTLARQRGDRSQAQMLLEEAIRVTEKLIHPRTRVNALLGLCEIFIEKGEDARGAQYAEEALWLTRTALSGDHDLELRALRAAAAVDIAGTEN